MKFAIVKTGGKQYLVEPNKTVKIEKLVGEAGTKVSLGEALLVVDGDQVTVGMPTVKGAEVMGEITKQGRSPKVRVVKYKAKTRYHKVYGHRQAFTEVKITSIK
jgi:large subunit ribosomal protein L21